MLYCTSFSSQGLVLMSCCSAAPQDTCVSPSHARARCFVCLLFVFDRLLLGTNFFEHVSTWQRGKMANVVPSDCAAKVDASHSLPEHGDGARVGASGEEVALTSAECELVLGVFDSDAFMSTYHALRRARSGCVTAQELVESSIDVWVERSNLSQVRQAVGAMPQVPSSAALGQEGGLIPGAVPRQESFSAPLLKNSEPSLEHE